MGITQIKQSIARKTCIPTTKGGMQRKIGTLIWNALFKLFEFLLTYTYLIKYIKHEISITTY